MLQGQETAEHMTSNCLTALDKIGRGLHAHVDLAKTFELHAAGKTKVITEVRKLEQVNEAFEEVETGKAKARLVFDFR